MRITGKFSLNKSLHCFSSLEAKTSHDSPFHYQLTKTPKKTQNQSNWPVCKATLRTTQLSSRRIWAWNWLHFFVFWFESNSEAAHSTAVHCCDWIDFCFMVFSFAFIWLSSGSKRDSVRRLRHTRRKSWQVGRIRHCECAAWKSPNAFIEQRRKNVNCKINCLEFNAGEKQQTMSWRVSRLFSWLNID